MTLPCISPIEDIIDDARNGRMYILVDDEDRENEGDLIIPAQMTTPGAINFMASYGRGLVCLALTRERSEELGLTPMNRTSGTRHDTAFMVSIEARQGVTTGISAADRARTISVAINTTDCATDLVSPGHVFPLVARDGGVLTRPGHTEAAVDVSRLAGLNPSGVICEIIKDDGTMARLSDLVPFANLHGLKIGTIRDLIAYRTKHDRNIDEGEPRHLVTDYAGEWKAVPYYDRAIDRSILALIKGDVSSSISPLVRVHAYNPLLDTLNDLMDIEHGSLKNSMRIIDHAGFGALVIIERERGFGNFQSWSEGKQKYTEICSIINSQVVGIAAQIISKLGGHSPIIINDDPGLALELSRYGLNALDGSDLEHKAKPKKRQLVAVA